MYLYFVLERPNALPVEDVTFLQSYKWLYKTLDTPKHLLKKSKTDSVFFNCC